MIGIDCLDVYDNPINSFTQWDVDQKIKIVFHDCDEEMLKIPPNVHFCNMSRNEALVVRASVEGTDTIVVDVPNLLLTEPYSITAYVYITDSVDVSSQKTVVKVDIPVRKRQKPSDYEYVENIERITAETIKQEIYAEFSENVASGGVAFTTLTVIDASTGKSQKIYVSDAKIMVDMLTGTNVKQTYNVLDTRDKTDIENKMSEMNTSLKEFATSTSETIADNKVEAHNVDAEAHNDMRLMIDDVSKRLNAVADSDDETLDQLSEIVDYIKDNRDLIDSVTTSKVNVSDIIDNLTTNDSKKPLSAAMGVKLKSMSDFPSSDKVTDITNTEISEHNADKSAHADIRSEINALKVESGRTDVTVEGSGIVHIEDALAGEEPIELKIKGRTVQNFWTNPSGTSNGVTVTSNADGSITLSGTNTSADTVFEVATYVLKPNTMYTVSLDKTLAGNPEFNKERFQIDGAAETSIQFYEGKSITFTTQATLTDVKFKYIPGDVNTAVSGTYKIMINEGNTAQPWCPPGLTSAEPTQVVVSGKNLATVDSISVGGNNSIITPVLAPGSYTLSGSLKSGAAAHLKKNGLSGEIIATVYALPKTFSIDERCAVFFNGFPNGETDPDKNYVDGLQLELGSTATDYEPPNIQTLTLDPVELRGLPDGTSDVLDVGSGSVEGNVYTFEPPFSLTDTRVGDAFALLPLEAAKIGGYSSNVRSNVMRESGNVQVIYMPEYSYKKSSDKTVATKGVVYVKLASGGTSEQMKSWLDSNGAEFMVEAETPTTSTVTPVALPPLPSSICNIWVNSNLSCPLDLSVRYFTTNGERVANLYDEIDRLDDRIDNVVEYVDDNFQGKIDNTVSDNGNGVVQIDDALVDSKPIEMKIYGDTRQNLWVNPSGTKNGVTVTSNEDGSMSISGEATAFAEIFSPKVYSLKPSTKYSLTPDKNPGGYGFYVVFYASDDSKISDTSASTITTPRNLAYVKFRFSAGTSNQLTPGTYRVMLREATEEEINTLAQLPTTIPELGDDIDNDIDNDIGNNVTIPNDISNGMIEYLNEEATTDNAIDNIDDTSVDDAFTRDDYPVDDAFTRDDVVNDFPTILPAYPDLYANSNGFDWCPPGLTSAEPTQVVVSGKNLLPTLTIGRSIGTQGSTFSSDGLTWTLNDDKSIRVVGTATAQTYCYLKFDNLVLSCGKYTLSSDMSGLQTNSSSNITNKTFDIASPTQIVAAYIGVSSNSVLDKTLYPQLELGSTATDYEPPSITTTTIDLQGHTLNRLPDGTRDELSIDDGGNVTLVKRTDTIAFDGSDDENWKIEDSSHIRFYIALSNAEISDTTNGVTSVCDDLYPLIAAGTSVSGNTGYTIATNSSFYVAISGITTLDSFKSRLKTQEMILVYKLATPQEINLGKIDLPSIPSSSFCNIWLTSNTPPSELSTRYWLESGELISKLYDKCNALESNGVGGGDIVGGGDGTLTFLGDGTLTFLSDSTFIALLNSV